MAPIRSFIAVDPSAEVAARLAAFVDRLSKETKGFKWVEAEGIHLTLRFLGEVDEDVLKSVVERLKIASLEGGPLSLRVHGIGFFPSAQRPRVVWAGLEGDVDRLISIQDKVEKALEGLEIHQEEKRGFKPHLTLARVKDPRMATGVARILQSILELPNDADFGEFYVKSLVLYKSDLTPMGARYTKLGEFHLGRQ